MVASIEFLAIWLRAHVGGDSERGASIVEYAFLLALIAVVCLLALQFLGDAASERLSHVGDSVQNAN